MREASLNTLRHCLSQLRDDPAVNQVDEKQIVLPSQGCHTVFCVDSIFEDAHFTSNSITQVVRTVPPSLHSGL